MQTEKRKGTAKTYVVRTQRRNGKQQKRYIGKSSDPVVQLFVEDERLAQAEKLAYDEACCRERDNEIAAEKSLEWLSEWSANWKVISELHEAIMHNKPSMPNEMERKLPGLHRFKEVCRNAEAGDADAQRQLDIWIAETPEILSHATDMIAVARDHLIQFVGSASPENSMLWQKQIDAKTNELLATAGDDPLSRMYAETTVLAWLSYMRSSLMPYVVGGDMKRSKYWGEVLSRSEKRWLKIEKAFGQHLKQTAKRRMRAQSESSKS